MESNDYNFIIEKEIEFIKFYGKKINNTGILSNLSDGGEGMNGFRFKYTEEQKLRRSLLRNPPERKKKIKTLRKKLNVIQNPKN